MLNFIPYKLKWYLTKLFPNVKVKSKLPFGGIVLCDFFRQRIYPGRISEKVTKHEYLILRHYFLSVDKDTVFFDIGANIGLHTSAVGHLMLLRGGGKIVSFEPEPTVYDLLKKNTELNNIQDMVTIEQVAVSSVTGLANFSRDFYSTATGCLSEVSKETFGHKLTGQPSSFMQVKTTTIDEYCITKNVYPTLVKIDVEGAEDLVLQGMLNTLSVNLPDIIIDGCTKRAAARLIESDYFLFTLDTADGMPKMVTELDFTVYARHKSKIY